MAFGFFSNNKSKGPQEVTCPLCENTQQESPLAVSSYCKVCHAYLTFEKGGEIKARAQGTRDPFAHRPPQPKVDIEYKAREIKPLSEQHSPVNKNAPILPASVNPETPPLNQDTKKPETFLQPDIRSNTQESSEKIEEEPEDLPIIKPLLGSPEGEDAQSANNPQDERIENSSRYLPPKDDEHPLDPRALKKKATSERLVACFECGDTHLANALANSTQCRKCGRLISLQDQHIKEAWSSKIQTRGNVYIHKKGIVSVASIQCHHLVVEGDFTGNAQCSGNLTLRRHGKIIGNVQCDRLFVEKRAKVEFLNRVEMNECKIDGNVTGDIACRGRLALEKKATLTGNIQVGTLTIADGAKHSGQVQMGTF